MTRRERRFLRQFDMLERSFPQGKSLLEALRSNRWRLLRIPLALILILGGLVSFLPVLGVWMLPLGLLILSIDFPPVRRLRRNLTVRFGDWFKARWPGLARRMGMQGRRDSRKSASFR